ncbi:uncharacterized protein [Palaemon carinicauda]|uniref:uncharacterized protein n=1 Tax=Palaemon carinicauda TaxID=392227 RepID=UPI0035B5EF4E
MDNYVEMYNLSEYRVRPNEYCKKTDHCLEGLECKDYQCQCPSPCTYNKAQEVCDCGGIEKPSVTGPIIVGIILGLLISCSWCYRIYATIENFHESRGRVIRAPQDNVPGRMTNSSVPGPVTVSGTVNHPQVKPPFGQNPPNGGYGYPPNGGYRYPPPPQYARNSFQTGGAYPRTSGQNQPRYQHPHTATPGAGYKLQVGTFNPPVYNPETSNPSEWNNIPRRPRSPPPPYEETVSDSQSLKQPPTELDRKPEGDDEKQTARPASAVSVSGVSYRAVSGHGAPGSKDGEKTSDVPPNVSV